MNLPQEEEKEGNFDMSFGHEQIMDQIMKVESPKSKTPTDSFNLDEVDVEIGEMTKYRIAKREEQLKQDWDSKIKE